MTSGDWSRLRPLLEALLVRPEEEHEAYLAEACGGDVDLAARARRMFVRERSDPDFLKGPVQAPAAPEDIFVAGTRVGPWRLAEPLGAGGMGRVWLAERADGAYQQRVALKLLRTELSTPALQARFDLERQVLAHLEHPGIARLLDGGRTDEGVPWLAMELVPGQPLDRHADAHKLSVDARLRLFLDGCAAVAAAHRALVIHRDLKPSNMLVDDDGRVRLLDFGIASLGEPADDALTDGNLRPFTPLYASPEQRRGDVVGTATDVYSLGVVLHELLTGTLPESDGDGETVLPSVIAGAGDDAEARAGLRGGDARRLRAELAGDLDAIVVRALRREPGERYGSVQDFAEDVRRHREHRPVRARPDQRRDRLAKFLRRNALPVAASGLAVVALLSATVVSWNFALDAREQAVAAEDAREDEAAARRRATDLFDALLARSLDTTFDFALRLQPLPGSATVGLELLGAAVADLEHLVALAEDDDPHLRDQLARAFTRLGDAQGHPAYPNVGDAEAAEASYRRALAVASTLPSDAPGQRDVRALCEARLGEILESQGRVEAATPHFERMLALREEDAAARASDRAAMTALALAHDKIGVHLLRLKRPDEAQPHLVRYLEGVVTLHGDDPGDALVALHVGFAHQRLGAAAWAAADYEISRDASRAAAQHFETLLEGDPNHTTKRGQAGWSWYWAGNAQVQLEEWADAESSLRRARAIYTGLAEEDPDNAQHFQPLGGVYEMLGNVEKSRAEQAVEPDERRAGWIAARDWYRQALELWQQRTEPRYAHLPEVMAQKIAACEAVLGSE